MKASNPSHVRNLIKTKAVTVKKRYGQNFLVDDNILKKIVETAEITPNTTVIEIGPGLGSLTQHILPLANVLIAYEIDRDLIPVLNTTFTEDHFHLIQDDVLKRNIDEDIKAISPQAEDVVVVANLPYYITTPILMKCLEESKKINRMVIMMQLEVGQRLTASKNTKDYNALSIAVQYRAATRFAFKVPKQVFVPAPNVDSAVIALEFHNKYNHKVESEVFFFTFIKACFKQRRKTLLNNLEAFLGISKANITEALNHLNIDGQTRAEALSIDQMIVMSNYFQSVK